MRGRPRRVQGKDRNAFARWADSTGMTFAVLAAFLRVSEASVRDWYAGRSVPTLELALRIARMSEGRVPVDSWPRRRRKPGGDLGDGGGGDEQAAS